MWVRQSMKYGVGGTVVYISEDDMGMNVSRFKVKDLIY